MSDFESLSLDNQEAIEELAWTLNASRGEFKLVIVRCNYGQLRDRAIVALCERVEDIVVWAMPPETTALLEGIREVSAAVMVVDLEGARELDELLSSTNRIREEFRSACPFPVVLWVTDAGLKRLMRSAPDFESWGTTTRLQWSQSEIIQRVNELSDFYLNPKRMNLLPVNLSGLTEELRAAQYDLIENSTLLHPEAQVKVEILISWISQFNKDEEQVIIAFQNALEFLRHSNQPAQRESLISYSSCFKVFKNQSPIWQQAKIYICKNIWIFALRIVLIDLQE